MRLAVPDDPGYRDEGDEGVNEYHCNLCGTTIKVSSDAGVGGLLAVVKTHETPEQCPARTEKAKA